MVHLLVDHGGREARGASCEVGDRDEPVLGGGFATERVEEPGAEAVVVGIGRDEQEATNDVG